MRDFPHAPAVPRALSSEAPEWAPSGSVAAGTLFRSNQEGEMSNRALQTASATVTVGKK